MAQFSSICKNKCSISIIQGKLNNIIFFFCYNSCWLAIVTIYLITCRNCQYIFLFSYICSAGCKHIFYMKVHIIMLFWLFLWWLHQRKFMCPIYRALGT